jgi:hypothetical protein
LKYFLNSNKQSRLYQTHTPRWVCVWYRYVDDTFLLLKDKNNAIEVLEWLNVQHRNIKFTCEFENDNKLPFLDVLVRKKGSSNEFVSTLYRKKTFTGVYLYIGIALHLGNIRLV